MCQSRPTCQSVSLFLCACYEMCQRRCQQLFNKIHPNPMPHSHTPGKWRSQRPMPFARCLIVSKLLGSSIAILYHFCRHKSCCLVNDRGHGILLETGLCMTVDINFPKTEVLCRFPAFVMLFSLIFLPLSSCDRVFRTGFDPGLSFLMFPDWTLIPHFPFYFWLRGGS